MTRAWTGTPRPTTTCFTAVLPPEVQTHRRLIRYRIRAWDGALAEVRVPYADDDCPNFAYFVYDGVPGWTGAVRPGVTPAETFSATTMTKVRPWHLLSHATDVQNCQYNAAFNDGTYRFQGTLVIDGRVYDHVRYRVKGQNSTYNTGKNKWKFRFNRGAPARHARRLRTHHHHRTHAQHFQRAGPVGAVEPRPARAGRSHGLSPQRAGRRARAPHQLPPARVIDGAAESNAANQFDGDLWGLYLAFENTDNHFKDEHGLPDGNIFRLQVTGAGNSVLGQGKGQPSDLGDLNAFTSPSTGYRRGGGSASTAPSVATIQPEAWFRANVDLDNYFQLARGHGGHQSDRPPRAGKCRLFPPSPPPRTAMAAGSSCPGTAICCTRTSTAGARAACRRRRICSSTSRFPAPCCTPRSSPISRTAPASCRTCSSTPTRHGRWSMNSSA